VLEKLHNLPSSQNAIRVIKGRTMKLAVRVKSINDHKILVGKLEGKRPLGRTGVGWEDIKTNLKEKRMEGVDYHNLAQDRDMWWAIVGTAMNLRVQQNMRNFSTRLSIVRFSSKTPFHGVCC